MLCEMICSECMEQYLQKVWCNFNGSLIMVGINQVILVFFCVVEYDFDNFEYEVGMVNCMVVVIYCWYNEENLFYVFDVLQLWVQCYQCELLQLKKKGDQFCLQLKIVFIE